MADRNVIAVFGATGAQGGGLARAILADPEERFSVRAITRDASSAKACALARLGAELVVADIDDEEMPTLRGRYKVPHMDGKGESDRLFSEFGVPTTFLLTSFYWESLIHFGLGPKRGAGDQLVLALPMGDKRSPGIASEDIGRCALGIFQQGQALIGKTIGIAGEHPTGAQMAAAFTEALGREVRYDAVTPEAFRSLGFRGAEELGNMFQLIRDFEDYFCDSRSIASSRSLNPAMQTFAAWLDRNKERFR